MSDSRDALLARLRETFRGEAGEHAQALSSGLVALEQAPQDHRATLIEGMLRSAHSLKGAARAVNFPEIEALCQRMEGVFAAWKKHPRAPAPGSIDALLQAVDMIQDRAGASGPPAAGAPAPAFSSLLERIDRLAMTGSAPEPAALPHESATLGETAEARPPAPADQPGAAGAPAGALPPVETVRVSLDKVERVLYAVEELLTVKAALTQHVSDLRGLAPLLERSSPDRPPPSTDRPDAAADPVGEPKAAGFNGLLREHRTGQDPHLSKTLSARLESLIGAAEQNRRATGRLVDQLLDETRGLLLLPFETQAAFFSKLVRDLARDQGKAVEFSVRGRQVELDKRILEEMKDPLIHILRNCIDHGIEDPEKRARLGKPERARITLTAVPLEDQRVELLVEDDGVGIDLSAVRHAAVQRGLIAEHAAAQLSDDEALQLIFRSEITTASRVTEVSGRGVGLAVVHERVEALGGRLSVQTAPGRGTSFRITLPVAQATFRGLLVEIGDCQFVLPTARIERVHRVSRRDVGTVQNRDTILLDGHSVSFVQLGHLLDVPHRSLDDDKPAHVSAIIVGSAETRIALGVDAVWQEQELLVKPLRAPLQRVRNVAAATVLGSGRVVPVLNVSDLLASAASTPAAGAPAPEAGRASRQAPQAPSVLVVEDSVTSRMLLKDILESAGYVVLTAVDGVDAMATLRIQPVDLVVSDVEMPRLDGFGLTAAIRSDPRLAELPVVLVTALATREDRERGIDAGANAYIVKSNFDQSDLLEAVRRLV